MNLFKVNTKNKWSVNYPEEFLSIFTPSRLISDLSRKMKNILVKMPVIAINKDLKNCAICNITIKKRVFQYPGDYNDCLLTCYLKISPNKDMETTVRNFNKLMLVKTTRVYNQKSQILIFTNFDVRKYENNLYNVYKSCNAHFIQVFQIQTIINRPILFILRNAIYYEFIIVNR